MGDVRNYTLAAKVAKFGIIAENPKPKPVQPKPKPGPYLTPQGHKQPEFNRKR